MRPAVLRLIVLSVGVLSLAFLVTSSPASPGPAVEPDLVTLDPFVAQQTPLQLEPEKAPLERCPVEARNDPSGAEPAFEPEGLSPAVEMAGCFSFCFEARRACSQSCWEGSGEAVFSCGPNAAGECEYTCVCCEAPYCN